MPNRDFAEPSTPAGRRKLCSTGSSDSDETADLASQEVLWEIGINIAIALGLAVVGHLFAIAYVQ